MNPKHPCIFHPIHPSITPPHPSTTYQQVEHAPHSVVLVVVVSRNIPEVDDQLDQLCDVGHELQTLPAEVSIVLFVAVRKNARARQARTNGNS